MMLWILLCSYLCRLSSTVTSGYSTSEFQKGWLNLAAQKPSAVPRYSLGTVPSCSGSVADSISLLGFYHAPRGSYARTRNTVQKLTSRSLALPTDKAGARIALPHTYKAKDCEPCIGRGCP
eukprot:242461-Rhodomonas_salina.2